MQRVFGVFSSWMEISFGVFIFAVLALVERYNFLLFHTLSELFSVVIAFSLFVLAYSARVRIRNGYLIILGAAFFHVGAMDLVHTLAFKGMGVFKVDGANLPTQLWIATRLMQGGALLVAGLFGRSLVRLATAFWSFAAVAAGLLGSVFFGYFPDCYVEGVGLTAFKLASELVICVLYLGALFPLRGMRPQLGDTTVRLIALAILGSVGTELLFLFYVGVYDLSLVLGHFAKVISFYLLFKAVVETGYARPQAVMFRDLDSVRKELQAAQTIAGMGSWREDYETGQLRWSEELYRLLGLEPGAVEPSEERLLECVHAEDRGGLRDKLARARTKGEGFGREIRYAGPNGATRYARVAVRPQEDGRVVGSFLDITAQKQAEQLRADVESITRHDLRSPLAGVISFAELLREESDLQPDQREMVDSIVGGGYKVLALLNSSLDLYRMEQGLFELMAKPVILRDVLERVLVDLTGLAGRHNVELVLDGGSDQGEVLGDELLCYSLFANLVLNALEASPRGAAVRVRLDAENGGVRVSVHNRGEVPEDVRERFFEKYATSGKRKGTGLGTYSARLITRVHGGDIGFTTSRGEGTTVWVTLPRA